MRRRRNHRKQPPHAGPAEASRLRVEWPARRVWPWCVCWTVGAGPPHLGHQIRVNTPLEVRLGCNAATVGTISLRLTTAAFAHQVGRVDGHILFVGER